MLEQERILVTGGSGLLGGELRRLLPGALYPDSSEFDVCDRAGMSRFLAAADPRVVLHGAAFTSPPAVEKDPTRAIDVNVIGTANLVVLCAERGIRLIYVSTDYVFRGDRGGYAEDSPVYPVNRYAWSKLGGECAARLYDRALIVRTSFGPNVFPYPKAFVDQWTSRESVRTIAGKLIALLEREELNGVIHLGGPRRSVYEYARSLDPAQQVDRLSRSEVDFPVPRDTSLDCGKYDGLFAPAKERARP